MITGETTALLLAHRSNSLCVSDERGRNNENQCIRVQGGFVGKTNNNPSSFVGATINNTTRRRSCLIKNDIDYKIRIDDELKSKSKLRYFVYEPKIWRRTTMVPRLAHILVLLIVVLASQNMLSTVQALFIPTSFRTLHCKDHIGHYNLSLQSLALKPLIKSKFNSYSPSLPMSLNARRILTEAEAEGASGSASHSKHQERKQNDDGDHNIQSHPLFEMAYQPTTSTSKSTFRVRDMSSLQQDTEDIFVEDEYQFEYDLEQETEEDEIGNRDTLMDINIEYMDDDDDEWDHVNASENLESGTETTAFMRDEDYMLTEREDRLYIDERGHRKKVETCVIVGVEILSTMRRARRRSFIGTSNVHADANEASHDLSDVYFSLEESLVEMRELIKTAGLEVKGEITQRMNEINPKTYIGTGKVKEAQELMEKMGACTVVFDAELTPYQQKALENKFNTEVIQNDFLGSESSEIKVIDRTALILDIFAQHAKTREGKLQVDLALHEFRKPRLTRMWTHLERQSGAGGVGLRGPGESQLEIDKRLVRDRIIVLKKKIDDIQKHRDMHRKGRERMGLPILAIVGYTNAGKSTLLNYLTSAGVMSENMLFATLDPTTRKVKLPGYKTHPEVLLTDTVGFIQKLPTQLVAAFRATLEEVREADVLVHISDVSNPVWEKQEASVLQVLSEIGAGDKPVVRVLNKIDKLNEDDAEDLKYEAAMMAGHSVAISSLTGEGMEDFVATVEDALLHLLKPIEVLIPYSHGKEVNMIQEVGHIESIDYREDGTYLLARVTDALANRLKPFFVNNVPDVNESQENNNINAGKIEKDEIDWVALGRGRHKKDKNNTP